MVPDLSELRQKADALEADLQDMAQQRQLAAGQDDDEVDSSEREKQRQLRAARAELRVRLRVFVWACALGWAAGGRWSRGAGSGTCA